MAIEKLETHPKEWVTVDELAEYWERIGVPVSRRVLYHYIQKGALPATKFGRKYAIRTVDARRFGQPTVAPISSR